MGAEVVPSFASWNLAGLGLFVVQVEALMAGEEVHPIDVADASAGQGFHEAQGMADGLDHAHIL